eukprot:sb/3479203/
MTMLQTLVTCIEKMEERIERLETSISIVMRQQEEFLAAASPNNSSQRLPAPAYPWHYPLAPPYHYQLPPPIHQPQPAHQPPLVAAATKKRKRYNG